MPVAAMASNAGAVNFEYFIRLSIVEIEPRVVTRNAPDHTPESCELHLRFVTFDNAPWLGQRVRRDLRVTFP
ncbi:hypothetical protein GCM10011591_06130 [Nocardia camponoti]|uniref:Uncharacterized protein n=1 Tax=Nocardia camponoti TaxID=1616106 RepID=A0A917V4S2_9NOCA|nr:hypothetical protein GCM10011591_06130 [Nocardia camponoti]